jgi:hypothetical protein
MPAGGGHFKGALDVLLALDCTEIRRGKNNVTVTWQVTVTSHLPPVGLRLIWPLSLP